MKLYGRLLSILATSPFKEKVKPLDKVVTKWTVLPNDLDIFGHMNNGRYAMVMDLARVDLIARLGMLSKVFKNRWIVPVGNTQIDYRRALKPFEKYEIHTQLVYWDDMWFYFKQDFVSASRPDKVVATGFVKAIFKGPKGIVPSQTIIEEVLAQQDTEVSIEKPILNGVLARKFELDTDSKERQEVRQAAALLDHEALSASSSAVGNSAPNVPGSEKEREPIAIVGIGCRFPGGIEDPSDLWDALIKGKDCVIDIPGSRWDAKKFYDPSGKVPGKAYVNKAGVLTHNIYDFDPAFFGISPREAEILDPMQRLLLEVSWEAFEDAGISAKSMAGSNTSVFVGGFVVDSLIHQYSPLNRQYLGPQSATASSLTLLANRLSYFYDFRGPSVSLDTACSSSLVAVSQACQSIWEGTSGAALVGGVNMLLTPETQISMCKGKFLSPNGRCNTFGAGADGYVRGEGSAMVVLKPLSKALEDGNQIYSLIRGAAVNQDGKTNGITVPNGASQVEAMCSALDMAKVSPAQINYMEAHGTGTPVGDPIEANALGSVLSQGRSKDQPCPVGSLKTNLGHMEASAGVGGLIKAALVLKHRSLVPHLHLDEVNPNIDFDELNLKVPLAVEPLPVSGSLYAGVNSFGYGGTNAHVILESPPQYSHLVDQEPANHLAESFLLSAESEASLQKSAEELSEYLSAKDLPLPVLSTALATQRSHLTDRAWVSARDKAQLIHELSLLSQGQNSPQVTRDKLENSKLMFVYTGMGPQWWAMGRELYAQEPVFKKALEACNKAFEKISGRSLLKELLADEEASNIGKTEVAQPANLAIQVALTQLFQSWGIRPDGVMGHSIGEVGSAWASGGLNLENAFLVAYHRSRLQALTAGKGGMLAVGLSEKDAEKRLQKHSGKVSIAAINSPSSLTLAGDIGALNSIAETLEQEGIFNKFLKVEVPYHSPVMNEIEEALKVSLREVETQAMSLPLYSTVTAKTMEGVHDSEYWWRNVRESVLFAEAAEQAMSDGYKVFVEIGPHPVLASSIREVAKQQGKEVRIISSLVRQEPEQQSLNKSLKSLYCAGVDLDWEACFGRTAHISLPHYAWDRSTYRFEGERSKQYRLPAQGHPLVSRVSHTPIPVWHTEINAFALPYVQDHEVGGRVLFPGAGYVELGIHMAKLGLQGAESDGVTIEAIKFINPAIVAEDESVSLLTSYNPDLQSFEVSYKQGENEPQLCARGQYFSGVASNSDCSLPAIREEFSEAEVIAKDALYASLADKGLVYGPGFQAVKSVRAKSESVLADISLPDQVDQEGYYLHPVILDAAMHSLIAAVKGDTSMNIVPMSISRIQWFGVSDTRIVAHGQIKDLRSDSMLGDIDLYSESGQRLLRLEGLKCRIMAARSNTRDEMSKHCLYEKQWQAIDLQEITEVSSLSPAQERVIVLHSQQAASDLLVSRGMTDDCQYDDQEPSSQADLVQEIQQNAKRGLRTSIIDLRAFSCQEETDALEQGKQLGVNLLDTFREIIRQGSELSLDRYILVTPQLEKVISSDQPRLEAALAEGLARTAMTEAPQLGITLLDLEACAPSEAFARMKASWGILKGLQGEQELACRGNDWYGLRLAKAQYIPQEKEPSTILASDTEAYALEQREKGKIESLEFVEMARPEPGQGQVVVKMAYSSLHFKDLMKVLGLLSEDALANTYYQDQIGMEGTGVVESVGEGVEGLSPGDEVFAWGPVMNSHICMDQHAITKLPQGMAMEDATNLVTYFTVYHGLIELARIKEGDTILIHSATGGVGLAAINLARYCGAKIIATAGSEEKRAYLASLGIEHVANSRDLSFVDLVNDWTEGKGVDVVLNFTPGEIMRKSLDCLAPSGRFVELGKQSFEDNSLLALKPFMENLSYFSVDIDRLTRQQPQYIGELVSKILSMIHAKALAPLPCSIYAVDELASAFRCMSRGDYIGKLAIKHEANNLQLRTREGEQGFSANASYLITGGLGGFGLQVAEWMSQQGAGRLILLSRSGPKSQEARDAIDKMEARGTLVEALSCDVSDYEALTRVFDETTSKSFPLRGVMHAAMVLDDRAIQDIDEESFTKVVNAKALSAWNLHRLTESLDLDFMVLFSSISSLVGNAGQANYVAANNYLDQLAHFRRARGLPALSINWGVFEETGVVARNEHLAKHLHNIGITPFSSEQATEALGLVVQSEFAQVGVMDVDWQRFDSLLQEGAGKSRFKLLSQQNSAGASQQEDGLLTQTFEGLDEEARSQVIKAALRETVISVMRLPEDKLESSKSLRDLGLDSLMAVEIDVEFSSRTGLEIPSSDIASGPSLDVLEQRLMKRLDKMLPLEQAEAEVC